jgi:hypothetical protein
MWRLVRPIRSRMGKQCLKVPKEIVVLEQQKSGRYAITDRVSLHGGPAQVATSDYRTNYERIFGRQVVGQA